MNRRPPDETSDTDPDVDPPGLADPPRTERDLVAFIREGLAGSDATGGVIALDGRPDSTVAATLAAEALGAGDLTGLILPAAADTEADVYDAHRVAEALSIAYHVVEVQPALDQFVDVVTDGPSATDRGTATTVRRSRSQEAVIADVASRLRMAITYHVAAIEDGLVLGAINRTDRLLGRFTEHGDGAADLLPLGDHYGSEVRDLARSLDVREGIVEKPPTGRAGTPGPDAPSVGANDATADAVLTRIVDEGAGVEATAAAVGIDPSEVRQYAERYHRTMDERRPAPLTDGAATRLFEEGTRAPGDAAETAREDATKAIRDAVNRAGAAGVILPVDGSLGAGTVRSLATAAIGPDRVHGVVLSHEGSRAGGTAEPVGVETSRFRLRSLADRLLEGLPERYRTGDDTARRALVTRLWMACACFLAAVTDRIVVGITDRTALSLGVATRHGDTGADLLPIGDRYRTEVAALGDRLGIRGRDAEDAIRIGGKAVPLETVDRILHRLVDCNLSIDHATAEFDVGADTVRAIARRNAAARRLWRRPVTPATLDRPSDHFYDLELRVLGTRDE